MKCLAFFYSYKPLNIFLLLNLILLILVYLPPNFKKLYDVLNSFDKTNMDWLFLKRETMVRFFVVIQGNLHAILWLYKCFSNLQ